jgi:hypothetical protein
MQSSLCRVEVLEHPIFQRGVDSEYRSTFESLERCIGTWVDGRRRSRRFWSHFLSRRFEAPTAATHPFLFVMAGKSSTTRVCAGIPAGALLICQMRCISMWLTRRAARRGRESGKAQPAWLAPHYMHRLTNNRQERPLRLLPHVSTSRRAMDSSTPASMAMSEEGNALHCRFLEALVF